MSCTTNSVKIKSSVILIDSFVILAMVIKVVRIIRFMSVVIILRIAKAL